MKNEERIISILQKFYSALRSLNDFGISHNIFEDISKLDSFFSEFRSITFVIQHNLNANERQEIYEPLRDKYLINNDFLIWINNIRVETIHRNPFKLTRVILLEIHGTDGKFQIELNNFESYQNAIDDINGILTKYFVNGKMYFTTTYAFLDENKEDFFSKILESIKIMKIFIDKLLSNLNTRTEKTELLYKEIDKLIIDIHVKKFVFTHDYELTEGMLTKASRGEITFGTKEGAIISQRDIRMSIKDNDLFSKCTDINQIFNFFIVMHGFIYFGFNGSIDERTIMPVFMIIYNDETIRLWSFFSDQKSTLLREIKNLINLPDFLEVKSVFYCGEMIINGNINEPKSESTVLLSFFRIDKDGTEQNFNFISNEIKDINDFKEAYKTKLNDNDIEMKSFFLDPIRNKIKNC